MPSGFRFIFSQFQLATAVVIHISRLSTINQRKIGRFLHFNGTALADDLCDPSGRFYVDPQADRRGTGFSREGCIQEDRNAAAVPNSSRLKPVSRHALILEIRRTCGSEACPRFKRRRASGTPGTTHTQAASSPWLAGHLNSRINTQPSTSSHQRSPK